MILKITQDGQIAIPPDVLEALGVYPGDEIELKKGADGFVLCPRNEPPAEAESAPTKVDWSLLAPFRDKIKPGTPPFEINEFRRDISEPQIRD